MKVKKTDKARQFLESGDFKSALGIVRNFRIGIAPNDIRTFQIAFESLSGNEKFYQQLGIDTGEQIQLAKSFINKYLNN
ncbi:MAG: hypothetical protein LBI60_06710 [Bacteroidales bacterium]|jgi:hypothetical protein|nr:hypothetical protein [Bacteroidales bacterium]